MQGLAEILEKVRAHQPGAPLDLLQDAYDFSRQLQNETAPGQEKADPADSFAVASTLTDLHMDEVTVACGLLHKPLQLGATSLDEIRKRFGDEAAGILEGLAKISRVTYSSKRAEQAEIFRRLILAMAKDMRVVIVQLAERLQLMRGLDAEPRPRQTQVAEETLAIYAPLANRLGIHRLKSDFEDLGFQYTMPDLYADLRQKVERRLIEREAYVEEVKRILKAVLDENEVAGTVEGRPKHFYSIYKKMLEQDIGFDKVYDLIAFRLIVQDVRGCYAMLGAIHARWTPIPGRFKDYIALPKPNLYQSLHTTVIGPQGQPIEIQIRTDEMHQIAEEGIAAHWRYKEKRRASGAGDRAFEWLRQLIEAHKEINDPQEFLESVKVDLFPDLVFIFTPAGDLTELPRGSTPVDFAYAVHTQVGERCVGARVNDRMVPLNHRLKNGDRVEIITSKHHTPSADWLEFVHTVKARNKIRQWIKTRQRERSIELGKEICDREFRKAGKSFSKILKTGDLEDVAQKFGHNKVEELLEAVGYGRVSARQILGKIHPELGDREAEAPKRPRKPPKAPKGIVLRGVGDTMVRFARCCNPLPGESVTGFVTRGHGLAVHVADCPNVARLDPERMVDVEWGKGESAVHPVKIRVDCEDRKGILASITQTLAQFDVNVASADVKTWAAGRAECNFEILVENLDRLQKILAAIQGLKGVNRIVRLKT